MTNNELRNTMSWSIFYVTIGRGNTELLKEIQERN